MSVLVKDMEMPKCCLECPFEDSPEFDSYCIAKDYDFIGKWEDLGEYKPDWCPLQDASTVGEWIPVSDGLPSDSGNYLITVADLRLGHIGEHTVTIADFYAKAKKWNSVVDVVAWMPLPEPYREDGEKE